MSRDSSEFKSFVTDAPASSGRSAAARGVYSGMSKIEWTEVPSAFAMASMWAILSFWFSPFMILFKVLAGMCVSFDKVA